MRATRATRILILLARVSSRLDDVAQCNSVARSSPPAAMASDASDTTLSTARQARGCHDKVATLLLARSSSCPSEHWLDILTPWLQAQGSVMHAQGCNMYGQS